MSVTEVKEALGSWDLSLRPDTPRELLDAIGMFGHIAVLPGRVDVAQSGDNLLTAARYVGVVRSRSADETATTIIGGAGMAFWLGDEDDKGAVWVDGIGFITTTFANTIRALLPTSGSVTEGTLTAVAGTYTGRHQYESPRTSITYVTDTFSTDAVPVSWRVNGNATLDAGPDSVLFVTNPAAILVRREDAGRDLTLTGMAGQLALAQDVEDYTTKVVLLAEGDGAATVSASASLVTPYRDLKGNPVVLVRLVSEFETDSSNAAARAQLQLNRFTNPRYAVNLSTDEYDVKGSFSVGDTIYVFDPDIGFTDATKEVTFRGRVINPKALTVSEMTWPITDGWTVAFRDQAGNWFDLSNYYVSENGATNVVVGEFSRAINDSGTQPVGSRPIGDTSIPAVPVFGATSTSSYQSDNTGSGATFAQIQLTWAQPLNTDGSSVVDGDHYEIRYRPTGSIITASYTNTAVSWGTSAFLVTGLMPGTSYDFQIQAVDGAVPPNRSGWSSVLAVVSSVDTVAPSAPAAPTVASSLVAIQVTHTLGKSSGGTYNLEVDLDRLEVHNGSVSSFTPSASTLVGKLPATVANIRGAIPAVGTFPTSSTGAVWTKVVAVDTSGNSSTASVAASANATLIDNAHISDLSVSKVTAGTIGATWIQGGTITTASSGARVELASSGMNAYNSAGVKTVDIKGSDGSATITGRFRTGFSGAGIPYLDMVNSGDRTTITFYNPDESNPAFINSPVDAASAAMIGVNSGAFTYLSQSSKHRLFLANASGMTLETIRQSNGLRIGPAISLVSTMGQLQWNTNAGSVQTGGQVWVDANTAGTQYNVGGAVQGGATTMANGSGKIAAYNSSSALKSELALFDDESIWLTGRFSSDNPIGGKSALFCNTWAISTTATDLIVSYGVTMATKPMVIYSLVRSGSNGTGDRISTMTTTGFTVHVNTGSTDYTNLNYWGFRVI